MNYLNLTPKQFCDETDACIGGLEFALTQPTLADVWDKCPRADWLLWILHKLNRRPDDRTLRLFAVWCARNTPLSDGRKVGDRLTDPRSLAALEVAERYANGNATDSELAAAWDAAQSAAWSAAWDAARSTARSAAWSAAWDAARSAAWDAAWDAARDAAWSAAWDAVRSAAWSAQADQLRKMIPNPFAMKEGAK